MTQAETSGPSLASEQRLATEALVGTRLSRGGSTTAGRTEGQVDLARPLVYPLPMDELPTYLRERANALGTRYAGMLFAADLDELPAGRTYDRVELAVRLGDPDARAVGLLSDMRVLELADPAGPVRPAPVPAETQLVGAARPARAGSLERQRGARVHGLLGGDFGWTVSGATVPTGGPVVGHAVVELPAEATSVAGRLVVETTISRSVGRYRHGVVARTREVSFDEPMTTVPPVPPAAEQVRGGPARRSVTGHPVRLVVSADIRDYSSNDVADGEWLQDRLVHAMTAARAATGVAGVASQPQGDCVVFVFPPGTDDLEVVPAFLATLASSVTGVNGNPRARLRLRLRVGVTRGSTGDAAAGFSGNAPVMAARLRDSDVAKAEMETADAALVAVLADDVYRDVYGRTENSFRQVTATAKKDSAPAWLAVLG